MVRGKEEKEPIVGEGLPIAVTAGDEASLAEEMVAKPKILVSEWVRLLLSPPP